MLHILFLYDIFINGYYLNHTQTQSIELSDNLTTTTFPPRSVADRELD